MDYLFKEMEEFAELNHVPIIKEAMANCGEGIKIKTLELSTERAQIAQSFIDKSPYKDDIEIVIGDAGENLLSLDKEEIFDYCEPHTCDFNHELGEQNSQRI